jgi:hypothetical protein
MTIVGEIAPSPRRPSTSRGRERSAAPQRVHASSSRALTAPHCGHTACS